MSTSLRRLSEEDVSTGPIGASKPAGRAYTNEHPKIPVPIPISGPETSELPWKALPPAPRSEVSSAEPVVGRPVEVGEPASGSTAMSAASAEGQSRRRAHAAPQDSYSRFRISWSLVALVAIVAATSVCVTIAVQGDPRAAAALGLAFLCASVLGTIVAVPVSLLVRRSRR